MITFFCWCVEIIGIIFRVCYWAAESLSLVKESLFLWRMKSGLPFWCGEAPLVKKQLLLVIILLNPGIHHRGELLLPCEDLRVLVIAEGSWGTNEVLHEIRLHFTWLNIIYHLYPGIVILAYIRCFFFKIFMFFLIIN